MTDDADRGSADRAATDGAAHGAAATDGADPFGHGILHDVILRQSADATIITDRQRIVRVWNPAAEHLYGIAADEAVGRPVERLLATFEIDDRPVDIAAATNALDRDGSWRQRVVHRPLIGTKAGSAITIDSIVTRLHDPGGDPIGALAVNRDVTRSARIESEMAALGTIVLATGQARTTTHVAETALDILCRATGADGGLVTSTDEGYRAIGAIGVRPETIDVIVSYGELGGPLATALQAPDAYISADVATAPLREDVREAVLGDGIRHLIVAGLRLQGRLIGILALGWRAESPPEPSRSIILEAAAVIASSLENARLLAAVESGLRQERLLTRRMRAMLELTRLPTATVIGDRAFEQLMGQIAATIEADGTVLAWLRGDHLEPGPAWNVDRAVIDPLIRRPTRSMPIIATLLDGAGSQLVPFAPDAVTPDGLAAGATLGYRALAAFAVRDESGLVGTVFAFFRQPVEDVALDERTLDAIARVLDISFANRRLREVVVASERRYHELFEGSPDALLVQTDDDIVVDANPAALRLYGDDLIGQSVEQLTADDGGMSGRDVAAPVPFTQYTGVGRRLDGTTFPEEVDVRPIEIGGEARKLVIVRDLTERSRMQAELVQAQKMEAIGMLVAGVAHELNNPLAAIIGFSHLIRTDPALPPDLRRQADMLTQEANRTRVIVQNLLDFARQRPPERLETDLRPLVDSVISLQSYILTKHRLDVVVDIPADVPPLWIDRSQIQQVLINLTVNAGQAIKSTGRPGRIGITARTATTDGGAVVRIAISDDGPGVAPAIRDRLFVPFTTTKEPGEGTGLGLSVSFGIVAGHGGALRYDPVAEGGAVFTIELPVDRPAGSGGSPVLPIWSSATLAAGTEAAVEAARAATDLAADDARLPPEPPSVAAPTRSRVLVLDDEPSIREFLGRVLARGGYEPILAGTGQEAVAIVRHEPPEAILCDHRMAGMNGVEFHAAVVEIDPALARRFAFMSGDVLNPELRDFATEHGIQLLAKPFDIATVGAMISRLLARGA